MNDLNKEVIYERLRYACNTDQLYSIKKMVCDEGFDKGSTIYQVNTGGGLSYDIHADNGLDLGQLSYKGMNMCFLSKNGYTSPAFVNPMKGEFNHYFPGGMMYTCGLMSTGGGNVDEQTGEWHQSHGRFHGLPAEMISAENIDHKVLSVKGRIRETSFFGHALEVERKIYSPIGESEIIIEDKITNLTPEEAEYMILYHFNFGYPFLSEDAVLELPEGTKTLPRTDFAAAGLGKERTFTKPVDGMEEQVYFHLEEENKETGYARILNPSIGVGAEICYSMDTLPILAQWKCMKSGEYVLGIEPTNSYIKGRNDERINGTIGKISGFGEVNTKVSLRFYDI